MGESEEGEGMRSWWERVIRGRISELLGESVEGEGVRG